VSTALEFDPAAATAPLCVVLPPGRDWLAGKDEADTRQALEVLMSLAAPESSVQAARGPGLPAHPAAAPAAGQRAAGQRAAGRAGGVQARLTAGAEVSAQLAVTVVPAAWPAPLADRPKAPPGRPGSAPRARRFTVPALLVILVIQAVLSLRLVRANTAFQDEGLYLWAGHLEIAHLLHGTPVPPFAVYFSGAPVIYPPLGALADGIGGLVLARCLSLAFMLAATVLLHGITRRIFDRTAALFAAALFAGTASAQFLGAFATYDAMALFLLAFATWLGVRSVRQRFRRAIVLLAAAGVALAASNATKYASVLFDPSVLATVTLAAWHANGRKAALRAAAVLTSVLALTLAAALAAGGRAYWHGIEFTTLARVSGGSQRVDIIYLSGVWVGVIVALSVIGAVTVTLTLHNRVLTALAWVLAVTSVLAPAEQARIETLTSLFKHVGYGALFASVIAGVALASFPLAVPRAKAHRAINLGIAIVIMAAAGGATVAGTHFAGWPNSRRVTSILAGRLSPHGEYLAEDDDVLSYYLANRVSWQQWTSTWFFRYPDPKTRQLLSGRAAYAAAIRNEYFNVIILSFGDTLPMDEVIKRDIARDHCYHRVASIRYLTTSFRGVYMVWVRDKRPAR